MFKMSTVGWAHMPAGACSSLSQRCQWLSAVRQTQLTYAF